MKGLFENLDRLREANKAAGDNFFEKTGVENLCMRVETYLIAGQYFVTSELDPADSTHRDRLCTIRRAQPNGHIETVGQSQQYDSILAARKAIREMLR